MCFHFSVIWTPQNLS